MSKQNQNQKQRDVRNTKRGLRKSYSFPKKGFETENKAIQSDIFTELFLKELTGTSKTNSEQPCQLQTKKKIATETRERSSKLNSTQQRSPNNKQKNHRKDQQVKRVERGLVQSSSFSMAQLNLNKFLMNRPQINSKRLGSEENLFGSSQDDNKKKGIRSKISKKKNQEQRLNLDQQQLIQVITDDELELFDTISQKIKKFGKNDTVIEAIWTIFETKKISFEILKFSIMNEINETELAETLFRRNSMATKLLNVIGNFFGTEYLINILKEPIKKILEDCEDLEVDQKKIKDPNHDISFNREKLKKKTKNFFDVIFNSLEQVPLVIREVCRFIRKETKEKFPEMELTSVGAFFFLRFICPVIASPEKYQIFDEKITPTMRRALIQTSKIIQTISNKVRFPEQSYMYGFNTFIEENEKPMFTFFEKISNRMFVDEISIENSLVNEEQVAEAVNVMKNFLQQNFEEIQDDLFKVTNRLFD
ncbi:ras gtpase-activating protein [Anaeramoeba flamelloides]|uniref:Ras gtpase-activating protein n=1 Tax=Anaeramoeba flamelloides TaxID=1746091 RepID=A0ABQ8YLU1_9EUKA|nr:ras gtpase-activating protein [Anaeramoeba flamelloides]